MSNEIKQNQQNTNEGVFGCVIILMILFITITQLLWVLGY